MAFGRMFPDRWRGANLSSLREVSRLQRRLDRLFDEMMEPLASEREVLRPSFEELEFAPACDIEETDTHYLLSFDLPGVQKNEIKVELKDHHLIVSGQRKEEKERKEGESRTRERYYGAFQRVLALPLAAAPERIEANFQNGVLEVAVPKAETSKPKAINIKEEKGGIFGKLLPQKTSEKAA